MAWATLSYSVMQSPASPISTLRVQRTGVYWDLGLVERRKAHLLPPLCQKVITQITCNSQRREKNKPSEEKNKSGVFCHVAILIVVRQSLKGVLICISLEGQDVVHYRHAQW